MKLQSDRTARRGLPGWHIALTPFVLSACLVARTNADVISPAIIRVEEDWELVVVHPEPNLDAPQVTCVISPTATLDGIHAALNINHQTTPEYVSGGLQLQIYEYEEPITDNLFVNESLHHEHETITWTQSMYLQEGALHFDVTSGSSESWGEFPADQDLHVAVASDLTDFDAYSPAVSVANSGVGYAGNRVTSLVLKEVRWYSAAGLVATDTDPKTVHPAE